MRICFLLLSFLLGVFKYLVIRFLIRITQIFNAIPPGVGLCLHAEEIEGYLFFFADSLGFFVKIVRQHFGKIALGAIDESAGTVINGIDDFFA